MEQLNMRRRPVRRVDISINMEATGANIRRLVKASGYSVRDIMAITGISTPAIETMLILCDTLGVTIKELLVIDGEFIRLRNCYIDYRSAEPSDYIGIV